MFLASPQHCAQTLRTRGSHALCMGFQTSGNREAQQNGLGKLIGVEVAPLLDLRETRNDRSRRNYPADTQTRESNLRKASEQNRTPGNIQLLDGRKWFAFVPKVA